MAYTHKMQTNRHEHKYIIDEAAADGIRRFVRQFLVLDEYADPNHNNAYFIHSLYLDAPDLRLAKDTEDGKKNRFKLRIRFYDEVPTHPVFFEIKRRVNDVILKERTPVHRGSVGRILKGHYPERSDLLKNDPKNLAALERFCSLKDSIKGVGTAFVSYTREAYVSPDDDNVRVTFDRNLYASPYNDQFILRPIDAWLQPKIPGGGVVLELKFTDTYPWWMHDLAQMFGLQRTTMAKYVYCVRSVERSNRVSHGTFDFNTRPDFASQREGD
jgi:hypothetical protein